MRFHYRELAAGLTLFTATAAGPLTTRVPANPSPLPAASASSLPLDAIYSRRALRRARLLIQMRMLELREERLDCIERAIRRILPVDLSGAAGKDNPMKPEDSTDAIYRGNRLLLESETCAWMPNRPPHRRRTA